MAKKVKCIECDNCMNWALPANVNHENINHAKHCLDIAKRTVVCGQTMKTKRRDNEQYCKHFVIAERSKDYSKQLEELKKKIERYEKEGELNEDIKLFKMCD